MTNVYTDAEYLAAHKQRSKLLGIFIAVTAFYAAFCIGWLIYYIGLPYKDPMQKLPQTCVYVISVLYVIFTALYMGIPFARVNRYYTMLTNVSTGIKDVEKNYFYCFEELNMQKDNVDMVGCVFETWNKKKCEWFERAVYYDVEMPLPEFESGDYIRYVTQSNIVLQYEILQKHALEFVEVKEDETPAENVSAEEKPAEEKPAGAQKVEENPTEEKLAEAQKVEENPAEEKPAESQNKEEK